MQLFDHHLGRRFAQRVFEFRDYAWRRHKHELIEVPILERGGERVRYGADEVLFGGLVQVAARLNRGAGGRCALLDPRRAIPPKLMGAFVQLRGDEARQRSEGAFLVAHNETRPPTIGDDVPKPGLLHVFTPARAAERAPPRPL